MSIMLFVTDIIKGAVRGYERRLANGRVVHVSPHSNSRGASKDAHTADLFAKPKAPPMKPSPYSDECMKKPEKCTHDLFGGEGATAEQLHAAVQNAKASGVPIHKSILVVTEDLLKATVKKELWIPAHTKKDGTFVHAHHKMVNVSDDHDHAKVGNGQGSHYQKAAHKKLADEVHGFDTLADHDKAMLVLAHATDLQAEASLSAAVSGWKASMLAGKEPTAGQKKAYFEYAAKYPAKVAKMATDIEAAIGADKAESLMGLNPSNQATVPEPSKPAMTPKEYGAAAFAAGSDSSPGFDQAFLDVHADLPYDDYLAALKEWQAGWHEANAAAQIEAADAPSLSPDAIDPHTIPGVAGWHASLAAGKVPTVEQYQAVADDGNSGLKHFDSAIAKHGHAKVAPLIDKAGDQWLAAQTNAVPAGPSADALEAVLPHMSVLAHVPSDALERSLKVIAHNTGIKASALAAAVQHIKDESKKPVTPVSAPAMPDVPEPGVAPAGETVLFDSINGHHVKVVKMPGGFYQSWIDETINGEGWNTPQDALSHAMATASKMPSSGSAAHAPATINTQGFEYKKSPDGSWLNVTTGAVHKAAGWKSAMLNMLHGDKPVPGQHAATYELAIENAVQLSGADPIQLLNLAYGPGMTYADEGPKEGDIKEINGKNYVLHGGRWHLQEAPPTASSQQEAGQKWTAFLENKNPGHSKFYNVEVVGNVLTKTYGKIGQKGHSDSVTFADHEAAVNEAVDIAGKKGAKGYSYVGTPGYPPAPPSSYGNPPASPAPAVVVTKPAAKKKKLTKEQQIDAVPVPAFTALDSHANSHQYILLCNKIKNAVKANGVTGLKSIVTFHNDGTVSSKKSAAGFKTGKCYENTGFIRRQLFHKFCKQMHAAALGKFDPDADGVAPSAPAQASSPAAAQPAGPKDGDTKQGADGTLVFHNGHWHKVEPAAPISVAKSKLGDHVSVMDSWPQTGPQEGSNPGGKFKDKGGQEWYCKFPADAEMVRSEFLAAKFYQMLGVAVPTLKLVEKDGKLGIASKWVDGLKKGGADQLAAAKGAHEAFAIDAWLGNWDVVGMSNDNLKLNKDGSAIRVDVGGSLNYRAMGSKKGADFGDNVVELKTMKDHSKNDKSAPVFAGATPAAMAWGGAQLNKLKPSQIEELCKIAGPGTDAEKAALAKKLIARRADVLKQMGIVDQWDKPPVDERKLTVNPADIKPPLNFNTLNGGKPVSSKQHINDKNSADSAALAAFAMQGNLKALKDYHYDAVDKDTGQSLGKKPITEHPSNHIQQQWASLIQTLQSIAYPPVDTLEMPSLGSFGLISEIADAAGSFAPDQNVTTIPQEHRLGYFMKLCQIDEGDAVALIKGTKWIWQKSGNSFVASLKHGYAKARSTTKTYISSVQGSGAANHLWSQGKKSYDSTPINKVTAGIYEDAVDLPEGTQMWRWMDDDTAGKSMTKQLLATKPGAILQNTDSMCTSFHESWGNTPHFTNGDGKQIKMRIRCAAGCKATPTYGTQSLGSEGELTTLPGQRYLVVDVKPGDSQHPNGVYLDVIMLPPDPGFVAQLNGQTLAKSFRSSSEWDKKKTVIVFRQEPSRTRQARPILAIVR